MRFVLKDDFLKKLREISKNYKVFVPVKKDYFHLFQELKDDILPDFSFFNTKLSPKSILFPQSERMFEYSLDKDDPDAYILKEAKKDFSPQIIVGIRPCDAHAFQIVKQNFDTPEYKDPWWTKRYSLTTFIGLACNSPRSSCFCLKVGGGPFSEKGLDAIMYDLGEGFLIKDITDKGRDFLDKIGGDEAKKEHLEKAEKLKKEAEEKIKVDLKIEDLLKRPVLSVFESDIWNSVSFPCITCGICTFLCPTCWCFDIQDEVYGKRGDRIRNWDSCMFPIFTLHASGYNPRGEKFRRVRQRFMHKLKYYPERYKKGIQCSGCGRCIMYCPTNMDIRRIINMLAEEKRNESISSLSCKD